MSANNKYLQSQSLPSSNNSSNNSSNKLSKMKLIEKMLIKFLNERKFSNIISLIKLILQTPLFREDKKEDKDKDSQTNNKFTKNQYNNLLKNSKRSNPDFLVYQEFINRLEKIELTEIQKEAIAFFLSRLLYFKILNIEDLEQNSNVSTNVEAKSHPDLINDFITILSKLKIFKSSKFSNMSLRLKLKSLFIQKFNSNPRLKGPNNLTQLIYMNSNRTSRIANKNTEKNVNSK
jgi:hypothetical protein